MLCVPVGKTFLLKAQHPGCSRHPGAWAAATPVGSGSCPVEQSAAQQAEMAGHGPGGSQKLKADHSGISILGM